MKTKKLQKKLSFNKEVISNLGSGMKDILAGGTVCPTCIPNATCVVECFPDSMDTCATCLYLNTICQAW